MGLESVLFGPCGGHDSGDATARLFRESKDVQGLILHLLVIHIAFDENGVFDFKFASGFLIVA